MNDEFDPAIGTRTQAGIDVALRSVGTATPAPGLEGRILTRLASARLASEDKGLATAAVRLPGTGRLRPWRVFSAPALCTTSACLVAVVIVAGSVSHSRRTHPGPMAAPPVLQLPAHGLGTASAVHPAAPASAPVLAGLAARGRSLRRSTHGRARIGAHAHKAPGVAVPDPNANPQN